MVLAPPWWVGAPGPVPTLFKLLVVLLDYDDGTGYCGVGCYSDEGRFSSYLLGARPCPVVVVLVRNLDFEFAEFARGGMLLAAA